MRWTGLLTHTLGVIPRQPCNAWDRGERGLVHSAKETESAWSQVPRYRSEASEAPLDLILPESAMAIRTAQALVDGRLVWSVERNRSMLVMRPPSGPRV